MNTFLSAFDRRGGLFSILGMVGILVWESTQGDLATARWFGQLRGFPLSNHFILKNILHTGARNLGWLVLLAWLVFSIWPRGFLKELPTTQRWLLWFSIVASLIVVIVMKGLSTTSCPWDVDVFGGTVPYVSHLDFWKTDGGGHCFPAGHASTGFAFMGAYFWLKQSNSRFASRCLFIAVATGVLLGVSQQIRGAHFTSHTLWTAWICWVTPWLMHGVYVYGLNKKN
ncbi:MAG: phosphatase PAP2 family protein [Limnohabitans sp.]|nr:phosphatase PAP2 family protein [Limnohabitans sp.]